MNLPFARSGERLAGVDALRGVAALAVCWFHFTNGNPQFLPAGQLKQSGAFGWLGVDVFFVISGFIVPYAMRRRGYDAGRDWARFVAKRVIRLDPPYLVAAALVLVVWFVSAQLPGFRGTAPNATAGQVFAHVGYLNGLLGLPWLNPVFWSLAIEFQFYVTIAFLFPIVAHQRSQVRIAAFCGIAVAALALPSPVVVFHYLGLFGCGLACFQYYDGRLGRGSAIALVAVMGGVVWWSVGHLAAIVATATALVILSGRGGSRLGSWLGTISYSLYLVHVPIGGRVVNAGTRFADSFALQGLVLAAALAASIAAAVVLHRFVELPALRWSAAIRYKPTPVIAMATALPRTGPTV